MTSATDQKGIRTQRARAKADLATNDVVIRQLMSVKDGRRYLWLQLAEANVFSSTICFGPDGYAQTAFREGQRSKGLATFSAIIRLCPSEYVTMTRENAAVSIQETDNDRSSADVDPLDS